MLERLFILGEFKIGYAPYFFWFGKTIFAERGIECLLGHKDETYFLHLVSSFPPFPLFSVGRCMKCASVREKKTAAYFFFRETKVQSVTSSFVRSPGSANLFFPLSAPNPISRTRRRQKGGENKCLACSGFESPVIFFRVSVCNATRDSYLERNAILTRVRGLEIPPSPMLKHSFCIEFPPLLMRERRGWRHAQILFRLAAAS